MEYKYQAIILNKNDVSEADRIYTAYTLESGKIRLLACGIRKPNAKLAGNLESISFSEVFVVKGRGSGKITGAINIYNFSNLKANIEALERVFYVFRIFDRLITQEEKDEKTFLMLNDYLETIDNLCLMELKNETLDVLTLGFIFKLFYNLGYGLEVRKCVHCLKKLESGENYFNAEKGGVVCKSCAASERRKFKINDETIRFIRIFSENKVGNLIKIKAEKKNIDNLKYVVREMVSWVAN